MKFRIVLLFATAIILSYGEAIACHHYKFSTCKPDIDCGEIIHRFGEIIDAKDSVKCYADSLRISSDSIAIVLNSLKRLISENATAEVMVKSGEFYSDAFGKIQSSFDFFLMCVSILAAFVGIIITGGSIFSHFKIMNEFNKYDKNISDLESKFKQDLKNQKDDLRQEIKNEIEIYKNDLKSARNRIFREIAIMYFSQAAHSLNASTPQWFLHFSCLMHYYDLIMHNGLELTDIGYLEQVYSFIQFYKDKDFDDFVNLHYRYLQMYLDTLKAFRQYCKETNNPNILAIAEKIYNESSGAIKPPTLNMQPPPTGEPS